MLTPQLKTNLNETLKTGFSLRKFPKRLMKLNMVTLKRLTGKAQNSMMKKSGVMMTTPVSLSIGGKSL